MDGKSSRLVEIGRKAIVVAVAAIAGSLLPATASADPHALTFPPRPGVASLPGPLAAPAQPAPQGLKVLKVVPASGPVGTPFTVSGEGLPAGKDVDLVWATSNASFMVDTQPETINWLGRQFDKVNVVLARARTDSSGKLEIALTAPEDYGDVHDIYAVVDGSQVAKAGFQIVRTFSVSPAQGVVGAPITIKLTGLGWHPYQSTIAVMYDNRSTGFISAVSTRGTAEVRIRAAGPVGKHYIELAPASAGVPYLDIEQSAVAFIGKYRTTFTVTRDAGAPRATVELPPALATTDTSARTTMMAASSSGVTANLSSSGGLILSRVGVTASGLQASAPVQLLWVTAVGTRAVASGWSLKQVPLGQAAADAGGKLDAKVQIPDTVGGWHSIQVVQGGQVKAQLPYLVLRTFAGIVPKTVKEGDTFSIHLKGMGWTEIDNTVAVTYDNAYIGYGCGFYSQGDINMNLVATGGPGTHIIDLYPALYRGHSTDLVVEHLPFLSFMQDYPGLALGYRLPAIHLAIQVTG